ncbi:MAG: hypothetical protein QXD79_05300 [Candidatus Methanomethylicia archaeon]
MERRLTTIILIASITPIIILIHYGNQLLTVIYTIIPASIATITIINRMSKNIGKMDIKLALAITHMYTLSLGQTEPRTLIECISQSDEYKEYRKIFNTILNLAINLAQGLTKAISQVAEMVKPPLKDILIRMVEAFSTTKPRDYLELEHSTIMEEYMSYLNRTIETIRLLGGVYGTFQSVAILIILVTITMSIFLIDPQTIILSYIVSATSTIVILLAIKLVTPRDIMVYAGKDSPPHQTVRYTAIILIPTSIIIFITIQLTIKISAIAFTSSGLTIAITGYIARKLEKKVAKYDEYYPTLIKTIGENLSTTLNPKSALIYSTHVHLGPLKKHVEHTISWINLGLDIEKSFKLMAEETASHTIRIMNKILIDSIRVGAPPIQVTKTIADTTIKILETRKRRIATARGMEAIILMMHPITILILASITNILDKFTRLIPPTQYITLNPIPTNMINLGNIILIYTLSIINAATMTIVRGGYQWRITLNIAILLIISGIMLIASDIITNRLLPPITIPI